MLLTSVTKLGDLLDFGSLFKAFNLSKSPTFLGIFVKLSEPIIFLVKSFLGNFYRHLAIFSGHTGGVLNYKNNQFTAPHPSMLPHASNEVCVNQP